VLGFENKLLSGTSVATALVTGIIALIRQKEFEVTANELFNKIKAKYLIPIRSLVDYDCQGFIDKYRIYFSPLSEYQSKYLSGKLTEWRPEFKFSKQIGIRVDPEASRLILFSSLPFEFDMLKQYPCKNPKVHFNWILMNQTTNEIKFSSGTERGYDRNKNSILGPQVFTFNCPEFQFVLNKQRFTIYCVFATGQRRFLTKYTLKTKKETFYFAVGTKSWFYLK
jgi:hypothetical protein